MQIPHCDRVIDCVMVYQRRRFTIINQLQQAIVAEWAKTVSK